MLALAVSAEGLGRGARALERGLRGGLVGHRVLERGAGLRDLQVELLRVHLDQGLARVDMLVVAHEHPLDIAGDPRKNGADVPLDLRVVGLLMGAVKLPVPDPDDGAGDEDQRRNGHDQDLVGGDTGLGRRLGRRASGFCKGCIHGEEM
jgi:hypothetical protein